MNETESIDKRGDSSSLKIDLIIAPLWINQFLQKQNIEIPISDQYNLSNLKVELEDTKVSVEADIKEKSNSSIKLECVPIWNTYEQRFFIEDIALKTDTNNILIKSAGWFANTFMGTKLDKKIEEALNHLFNLKKEELIKNGIPIPLPDGKGHALVKTLEIEDMKFSAIGITVKAQMEVTLEFELGQSDLIT